MGQNTAPKWSLRRNKSTRRLEDDVERRLEEITHEEVRRI